MRRVLPLATAMLLAWQGATARADWSLVRFEGRDYVSLEQVATFYGLPKPPTVAAPGTPPMPVPAASAAGSQPAEDAATAAVVPMVAAGSVVTLESPKYQVAVAPESREAAINGVKHWLSFPVKWKDGQLFVSTIDLAKNLEPHLRPEKIEGLAPFTTVVLDAGHGGHDKGAASRWGFEKDFALDVATRLKPLLEKRGLKVVMTRTTDRFIPLPQRPAVANGIKDSIFVAIHFNSATSNPLARGFEIYSVAPRGAPATNDPGFSLRDLREEAANAAELQSSALASSIYHSMLGNVPLQDRGIKHARFAVLRLCKQPSVLIECGFVSNGPESALIGSEPWRQSVAEAIATGLEEYKSLAESKHVPKVVAEYRKDSVPVPQ